MLFASRLFSEDYKDNHSVLFSNDRFGIKVSFPGKILSKLKREAGKEDKTAVWQGKKKGAFPC